MVLDVGEDNYAHTIKKLYEQAEHCPLAEKKLETLQIDEKESKKFINKKTDPFWHWPWSWHFWHWPWS